MPSVARTRRSSPRPVRYFSARRGASGLVLPVDPPGDAVDGVDGDAAYQAKLTQALATRKNFVEAKKCGLTVAEFKRVRARQNEAKKEAVLLAFREGALEEKKERRQRLIEEMKRVREQVTQQARLDREFASRRAALQKAEGDDAIEGARELEGGG